ncbi:MAG TPA: hypothetical protein VLS89_04060 [Candidatus Nanopelagicales bacterium]|nr:hypothetical protein [Candidatus Nanopelagicales bacterium]
MDLETGVFTPIATIGAPLTFERGDLRSTGDGRLFGFYMTMPTRQIA